MFDFHTYLTETCPDLISQVKNIRTWGIYFGKAYGDCNVEHLHSSVAKALLANQNIESLQLMCNYADCKMLADELISAERLFLTGLRFLPDTGVITLGFNNQSFPDLCSQSRLRTVRIQSTVKDLDTFLRDLSTLPNLETLEIVLNELDSMKLLELGSIICLSKNLKKLVLSNISRLGDFLSVLDTLSTLEQVVINIIQSDNSSHENLNRFIKSSRRLPSLTLHFCGKDLPSEAVVCPLIDAIEKNVSLLRFEMKSRLFQAFKDSADRLHRMVANHPFLESAAFCSAWNHLFDVSRPFALERRIDAYHLIRHCRFLSRCRYKSGVCSSLPFELIEKIVINSSLKSESWAPKKLRVIIRCLLSRRTIGKISTTFKFSAESLYWACKQVEELI